MNNVKLTPSQAVDEWIKAKCELKGKCLIKTLFASYKAFTLEHGYPTLTKADWSLKLSSEGFKPYRMQGQSFKSGLNLKDNGKGAKTSCLPLVGAKMCQNETSMFHNETH